jgi:hypothetical protein
MNKRLTDAELAAQLTMPPEWAHPLQSAAVTWRMTSGWRSQARFSHGPILFNTRRLTTTWRTTSCWRNGRSVGHSLTFKSNKNREDKKHHCSEIFRPIEIECIDNLPAIGATGQRYGGVGLHSSEIDPIPSTRDLTGELQRSEFWANHPSYSKMKCGRSYVIEKVAKAADTQSSIFTCHGQSLTKTAMPKYSRSESNGENASA